MNKVRAYGLSDQLCDWIEEFLDNRKQQVILNGEKSSEVGVMSGVPQGSVVGPLLFTIYINELVDNIGRSLRLFADDAVVYREVVTMENCIEMQEDLHRIDAWCREWQLKLSVDKCNVLRIHRKKDPLSFSYAIAGQQLEAFNSINYLGVE